ncbi:transcriptional regulator, IclR family (plasmid) [Deinococcus proteolyticus MRP]|uniref:Transcriptional regulator, IclR family n=1 Tax=Deinococcus proteolyticus (strain ATCC 35074 / DSM 20540 / JCM 6276 / NBRC 101906 / NCIMB 13154 / VKM Ac-1939 / CCM 2703 / MRP) TaxID=693977 RepID=F0RPF0_DEIPM|nr:IclR family transcriptional regulator C-terminal domain-containing protein [Deinococcus proteolyticus]ADY27256.1 transcriptional regulator, IclR family [Deinococcus proteolyticus MRP]
MSRTLQTVTGAVRILEAFDADRTEWRLSELAAFLDLPTSTLHEQLETLTATGLLHKLGRGRYGLGWRLLKLSSALYSSLPWYGPAHDAMNALARGTRRLAFVAVLDRGTPLQAGPQVLCIARSVQGREGEAVEGETRFELPARDTASGRLLFALHGLALPLPGWPDQAAAIRAAGLAVTQDEWSPGTSSLAAPVRGAGGEVLCALGLSLPSRRLNEREMLERRLRAAAGEVSWALGCRPPPKP